jgi:hypothetical protein
VKIELFKRGKGFLPASLEAEQVHARMSQGEIAWFKVLRIRDPVAHRRYWALMDLSAQNCEQIAMPYGGFMRITSKDDVHTAIKFWAGYCTWIFDANGKPVAAIPKSTNYESMTRDEWNQYWPKVVEVVQTRILPGVSLPAVELELMKCMGLAA